jgi:hypothetical protein
VSDSSSPAMTKQVIGGQPDPLKPFLGVPVLNQAMSSGSYVGRVIAELWSNSYGNDVQNTAVSADSTLKDNPGLLQQVAQALPGAQLVLGLPNALSGFAKRPIISGFPDAPPPAYGLPVPGATYLGRVVAELWTSPNSTNAATGFVSTDAVDGDSGSLLQRVAQAMPQVVANLSAGGAFRIPPPGQTV